MEDDQRSSQWQMLHDRGVRLDDDGIDFITSNLSKGIELARLDLNIPPEEPIRCIFSDNQNTIGYAVVQDVINIPVPYLNRIANAKTDINSIKVSIIIDEFQLEIPYQVWLEAAGIEEVIHMYQKRGHSTLIKIIKKDLETESILSSLQLLLLDVEVEARKNVDRILKKSGRLPIWEELDKYLLDNYSDSYGKPKDFFNPTLRR